MSRKMYENDDEWKKMPAPATSKPRAKTIYEDEIDIFGNYNKREIEELKKLENLARSMNDPAQWSLKKPSSKSKLTAKESLVREKSHNSERILSAQQQNERIDKALEFIDTLPFQEGDVAFHKDYDNVIVDEISINMVNPEESSYYIIARGTKCNVPYQELVPISEATKILFSKK